MKVLLLLLVSVTLRLISVAQTLEEKHSETFWCPNDTFRLRFEGSSTSHPYRVSREDKESPGTDASPNAYAVIYYGKDSIRLNYHNKLPYAHRIYLDFASPKGKTTLRFHFNELTSYFSTDYMEKYRGGIQFSIPETYELANIIWILSPSGKRARDLPKGTAYYNNVMNYFQPHLNHPIFKALDFPDSLYANNYYDFRENSFAFNFQDTAIGSSNTKLLFNGPYYYVYGNELADSSLFGKLKPLVEDFAAKSRFRDFYKKNLDTYRSEIYRQKELLPVKQMWSWLEEQFPKSKYQSYRIVFSPLIGGSHSTQNYATYYKKSWFQENVMFVCGSGIVDADKKLTEKEKEGLLSGIVFTEIDHNYVNPATNKYAKLVDSIFSKRSIWAKSGTNSDFYGSTISVFNEYMTHSLFCLYILDNYEKATADLIIDRREKLMVDRRNFIRFKEFNTELIRLRNENKNLKVVDLYPMILEWCRNQ